MIDDELMIHTSGTTNGVFEDWEAVIHYLGGLYRTDTRRKVVNKHTATNLVIERTSNGEGFKCIPFGGSVMRNHLRDRALEQLKELTDGDGQDIVHNVMYIEATYPNNDIDILPVLEQKDLEWIVQSLITVEEDSEDYLLWVLHQDHLRYHIHGLKFDK